MEASSARLRYHFDTIKTLLNDAISQMKTDSIEIETLNEVRITCNEQVRPYWKGLST